MCVSCRATFSRRFRNNGIKKLKAAGTRARHPIHGVFCVRANRVATAIAPHSATIRVLRGSHYVYLSEPTLRRTVGSVGLGNVYYIHHVCSLPIDPLLEQVLKANPSNLVVSTLYDSWQVGLLIAAARLIKVEPPSR